jgi:activator of 2-hydroxyglutaryl-CoA dehydratase
MIFSFFSTIVIFVKYIFTEEEIIIKYPLLKEQTYFIENIIGLDFERIGSENLFIIYFENKKLKMEFSDKRFKEKINKFYEANKSRIIEKNIETIKTNGFIVFLSKSKYVFYNNRVEISGKKRGRYYYDKDIKSIIFFEIVGQFKRLDIVTNDNHKIRLLNNKCKSGMGLFEFLIDNIKYPNVA